MNKYINTLKLTFLSLAAVLVLTSADEISETMVWNKTTHDFGTVKMGPKATFEFVVKNKSAVPVSLKSVQPGCSCTASEYTKEPILPGKSGFVKAVYGTDGRPGFFKKSINVTYDNNTSTTLFITGTVTTDTGTQNGSEL